MTKDDVLFGRQALLRRPSGQALRRPVAASQCYYPWKRMVDRHGLELMRHSEGDLVGQASAGVSGHLRQEIVSGAEHRSEQQVEVGEHSGPHGSTVVWSTADFNLLRIEAWGWNDTRIFVLSAVRGPAGDFVHRQATIANPLRLFLSRNVAGSNALQALLVAGVFGMLFLGALYLQRVLRYSPLKVGLAFLPPPWRWGPLSLGFSEKMIMRFDPRNILIPGVCLVVVALLLFARTPVDANYLTRPPGRPFLLIDVDVGTSLPAITALAMSGATPRTRPLASGLVNTSM